MDCLNSLVSYKKQCLQNGTAKYLIQSLPAISTEFAANIASYDDVNSETLFETVLTFNANLISERIRTLFNSLVVPSDIFSACACAAPANLSDVTFQTKAYPFGVQLIFNNVSKSGFFFIEKLRVLASNTVQDAVFTIEESDGSLTTFTANITGNSYNNIDVNYKVKTNKVFIYVQGLNLAKFICFESSPNCGCGGQKSVNGSESLQKQFISI